MWCPSVFEHDIGWASIIESIIRTVHQTIIYRILSLYGMKKSLFRFHTFSSWFNIEKYANGWPNHWLGKEIVFIFMVINCFYSLTIMDMITDKDRPYVTFQSTMCFLNTVAVCIYIETFHLLMFSEKNTEIKYP